MSESWKGKLWDLVLFLLLTGVFYFYDNYLTVGGFGVGYQYLICFLIIGLGFYRFLEAPDPKLLRNCVDPALIMAFPYLLSLLFSFGIWIFSFTELRQMISGFFDPVYMLISIAAAASLSYMLRGRTVPYIFWAASLAYLILIAIQAAQVGPAEYIREMGVMLTTFSQDNGTPAMKALEAPRFSYIYVFFLIYFIFHFECQIKSLIRIASALFFFLTGFKRSCILAVAAGIVVGVIYLRCPAGWKRILRNTIIVSFTATAFLYIPFIKFGLFSALIDRFHIDTSYRRELYDYYAQYYDYNPSYMGRGLGWVTNNKRGKDYFVGALRAFNVHNEFLKHYIELGFVGYAVWLFTILANILRSIVDGRHHKADTIVMACMTSMFILYFTENIIYFYSAVLVLTAVIGVSRIQEEE